MLGVAPGGKRDISLLAPDSVYMPRARGSKGWLAQDKDLRKLSFMTCTIPLVCDAKSIGCVPARSGWRRGAEI